MTRYPGISVTSKIYKNIYGISHYIVLDKIIQEVSDMTRYPGISVTPKIYKNIYGISHYIVTYKIFFKR